jgi:hypothetical protein
MEHIRRTGAIGIACALITCGNWAQAGDKALTMTASCGQQTICKVGDLLTVKVSDKSGAAAGVKLSIRRRDQPSDPKEFLNWALQSNFDETSLASTTKIPDPTDESAKVLQTYPGSRIPLAVALENSGKAPYTSDIVLDVSPMYDGKQWALDTVSADCTHDILGRCTFGELVTLTVPNYRQWIDATKTDASKLQLLLDGMAVDGVPPIQSCSLRGGAETCKILFRLLRDPANEKNVATWQLVIAQLNGRSTSLNAALGVDGRPAGKYGTFNFDVQRTPILEIMVYLVLLFILFILACRSDLTRDTTVSNIYPQIVDQYCAGPYRNPASLAKTQMALWTIIVFFSYIYLWIVSWDLNTLNTTALALMGLSAGTAVGARLVDTTNKASLVLSGPDSQWLADLEKLGAAYKVASLSSPRDMPAINAARKAVLDKWQIPPAIFLTGASSFWRNLVSGDNDSNTQLHRLQIAGFTIFLACVFVLDMLIKLAMPSFSQNVLALMGISGATYVGFKFAQAQ